jgi:excisionase family DNA binding protein
MLNDIPKEAFYVHHSFTNDLAECLADSCNYEKLQDWKNMDKEFLTVAETAERLQLCTKKVYQLCNSGELDCCRAGRAIRIPARAVPMSPVRARPTFGFQHF